MDLQGVEQGEYLNFMSRMTSVEPNVFRGTELFAQPYSKIAFGGHLLMQAASAAICSVPDGFYINSLHNYFLSPGQAGPATYHVDNVRDGKTFCIRYVRAVQNGKTLLTMQVSFKRKEPNSLEHQWKMPECPPPEELKPANELFESKIREVTDKSVKRLLKIRQPVDSLIENRPVDPETMFRIQCLPPRRLIWIKLKEKIANNLNHHRCALTYVSDYLILATTLLPNTSPKDSFFITSLDHSIWFHNDLDMNDWLLYETESSHAGGGVGFSTGRFWTRDGTMVASISQQGVIRALL